MGEQVKADGRDAELPARYLALEAGALRVWTPLSEGEQRFWHLLKRRATLSGRASSCSTV